MKLPRKARSKRRRLLVAGGIACLLLVAMASCHKSPPARVPTAPTLQTATAAQLVQAVAQHRGKVVLVDYWATWCQPCLRLFPHTMGLAHKYHERGLAVITVSLDGPDGKAAAQQFLQRPTSASESAPAEHFLAAYDVGPDAFTALDISDGALPHVKLYGRDGQLLKTFASGGQSLDPQAIEQAVAAALQ